MSAAINVQCRPTPFIWVATGPVKLYRIADEAGQVLTDEAGQQLKPDRNPAAAAQKVTNEAGQTIKDENDNEIAPN